MDEIGVVVERLGDGTVVVEVDRTSACERCHARGACQTTLQPRKAHVTASDSFGAAVGQRVRVEMADQGFLGACFQAFVVPLAALVVGAAAGFAGAGWVGWPAWQDAAAALGALVGAGLGLLRMGWVNRRLQVPGAAAAERYRVWVREVYS